MQINIAQFNQMLGKQMTGDEIKAFQIHSLALNSLINDAIFEDEYDQISFKLDDEVIAQKTKERIPQLYDSNNKLNELYLNTFLQQNQLKIEDIVQIINFETRDEYINEALFKINYPQYFSNMIDNFNQHERNVSYIVLPLNQVNIKDDFGSLFEDTATGGSGGGGGGSYGSATSKTYSASLDVKQARQKYDLVDSGLVNWESGSAQIASGSLSVKIKKKGKDVGGEREEKGRRGGKEGRKEEGERERGKKEGGKRARRGRGGVGEYIEVINKRMQSCEQELSYSHFADFTVVNDEFLLALNNLIKIILFNKINSPLMAGWIDSLIGLKQDI